MKKLLILLLTLTTAMAVWAEASQVLVFRKSGEVNIFYTDRLERVENTNVDADGISRDEVCAQRFVSADTTVIIPIADIDSVAFNGRDAIKAKAGVHEILPAHLPYITAFDGNAVTFRADAPEGVVPAVGAKMFFNGFDERFPYGLCARETSRAVSGGNVVCMVENIPPTEVFDYYFVAGNFEVELSQPQNGRERVSIANGVQFELDSDNPDLKTDGMVKLRVENLVGSPLTNYFSADFYVSTEYNLEMKVKFEPWLKHEFETPARFTARTTVGGVISPKIEIAGFLDVKASLNVNFGLTRRNELHYRWKRLNGENSFELMASGEEPELVNEARIGFELDGELFFGILVDLSINTIFDMAGAGVRAKVGPKFSAEFGPGALQDLTESYNPTAYAKAKMETELHVGIDTYAYYVSPLISAEREEIPLPFHSELSMSHRTWDLLPKFMSRAVRAVGTAKGISPASPYAAVDIASSSSNEIAAPLEVGFELTDKATGEFRQRIFTDEFVRPDSASAQGFTSLLDASGIDLDAVEARPVVKYGDYVVKCPAAYISSGANISPSFFSGSTPASFIMGGAHTVSQKDTETTTVIVGNPMPTVRRMPGFETRIHPHILIHDPNHPDAPEIYGTWTGQYQGEPFTMTLNRDNTARYNGESATFELNTPSDGRVRLTFADGRTLVFEVLELGASDMSIEIISTRARLELTR